ncbi:MAG: serine/threonine-protein kinase [Chlamydiia bacterium]|nr:serine/threonine-protein kinase [Chlamydiia bacterium]
MGSKFAPFGLPQPRSLSPESSRLQENIKPAVSELSGELASRFPLFKADSDLAEKTAQVLKDNGIHSIGEPLGKGGFGGVYEVQGPSEKPLALKILEKAIPYSDREGEGLTLNLPRHRKLQTAKAFILRDRLTGNVYYHKVGDRLPSNRGGLEIIATLSRKQKKETIRTLVKRGPLPISKVKGYGRNLVRGVGAMHKEGLVHGDLKPDNLLLPEREGDDRIKIADFGLATKNQNERRQGGTPPYMNPACALVRPENDWYSTGVTLLEMATGSPFSKPEDVKDPSLRDLLYNARTGLITNPGRIQSEAEILNHPFFRESQRKAL